MGVSSRGLFDFIARLRRPPAVDSDADLIDRFVRTADESAFTGLVRRHAPMVMSVCRRRLGREADAEDAFQAVFLALATSARCIGRRDSLPGWLYRVAYLISLKAAGRRARQPATASLTAEVPMPDPPPPTWETDELKAVIDAEVAGLTDKLRAVIVLCLIEGRTNSEAATILGVPVGTVDSRLNAARKKLQSRLTRRGIAAIGMGITLEQMLGGPIEAAGPKLLELVFSTVSAVLTEVAGRGSVIAPAVADLARGATTMAKFRLLTVLGITLGVLGSAGAGIYFATAADPPKPVANAAEPKVNPPAVVAPTPAVNPAAANANTNAAEQGREASALLKRLGPGFALEGAPLEEIFARIEEQTDLIIRVDVAAFRRVGAFGSPNSEDGSPTPDQLLKSIYDTKPILPRQALKMPIRDVLADALAQVRINFPCTYQVRGSQLIIVPAYVPPNRPGGNPLEPSEDDEPSLTTQVLREQIYGGVVSVTADRKPLADILSDLRKQTGANIVLDPRCEAQEKKATLSITLSDVRLYDALRVIADMAELKMVYAGNIYYVTTVANAKSFQPPTVRTPNSMGFPLPQPQPQPLPQPGGGKP